MGRREIKVGCRGIALDNISKGDTGAAFFDQYGEVKVQAVADIRQGYWVVIVNAHQGAVELVESHVESYLHHDYVGVTVAMAQNNPYVPGTSQRAANQDKPLFVSESTLFFNATGAVTLRFNDWESAVITLPANFPITFNTRISKFWVVTIAAGTLNVWMEGNHPVQGE